MTKRFLLIILTVMAALTVFSLALSRRDSEDWRSSQVRKLFPFPWRDVANIRIERPQLNPVVLEKDGKGDWQMQIDGVGLDSANPHAIDELSALVMLPWREPLEGAPTPDPEQSLRLTMTSLAGEKITMLFGAVAGNRLAAASADDPESVFGVVPELARVLEWPETRFRNFYLAHVGQEKKVERITLSPARPGPAETIELVSEQHDWRQSKPVSWPVSSSQISMLLGWVERVQAEGIAAEEAADPLAYGFSPDSPVVELVYSGEYGKKTVHIQFGSLPDENSDSLYARTLERNPVFIVPKYYFDQLYLDQVNDHPHSWANIYRKRDIDLLETTEPNRIVVEKLLPDPLRLTIERTGEGGRAQWQGSLEAGGTARHFNIDPPGDKPTPLGNLLEGLSDIRIKNFLAESEPGADTLKWTAYPAWRFSVQGKDGVLTLYSIDADGTLPQGVSYADGLAAAVPTQAQANDDGDGIAASVTGCQAVFSIFPDLSALLCLPPYRYQSSLLADLDPQDWTRVSIAKGGETAVYVRGKKEYGDQWWLDGASRIPLMDGNNQFVALLYRLSRLRGLGFVSDTTASLAEFGLDQPEFTVIVYGALESSDKGEEQGDVDVLMKLSVGRLSEEIDGARYARLNDDSPVFLLGGDVAEALAKDYLVDIGAKDR